ncbi:putative FAD-linked oxidoreductase [Candidatus Hepatincola sp. Av]
MTKIPAFQSFLSNFLENQQILLPQNPNFQELATEKRGNFSSNPSIIVLPKSVEEVAKIITYCYSHDIPIIPQSGNTGLVGGAVAQKEQVILNSKYLNKLLDFNETNRSFTCQSGVTLWQAQTYARQHNLMFPLSLPSEKTCTIGGNLATNAGGIHVLKYGNMRDLTLGLEVVLPNGNIISDLHVLRKRNIGSDFKHLFIGAEGILGFICAASLKLFPKPYRRLHTLVAIENIPDSIALFTAIQNKLASNLCAFEIFNQNAVKITLKYNPKILFPLPTNTAWYVLMSFEIYDSSPTFLQYLKTTVQKILKTNKYYTSQDDNIWDLRFAIPESQSAYGISLKHDISLPLSSLAIFIEENLKTLNQLYPNQILPIIFGHLGDGNLHFNLSAVNNATIDLKEQKAKIKNLLVNSVMNYQGSFCAEHGVGLVHKEEFQHFYKNNQAILMRLLKNTLDTNNIFNPKKILSE